MAQIQRLNTAKMTPEELSEKIRDAIANSPHLGLNDDAYDALHELLQRSSRERTVVLRDTLRLIVRTPSHRTLLLNAEARAMYELAKRTLDAL